jgi:transcriptional regulator with XRE-family HTH domain
MGCRLVKWTVILASQIKAARGILGISQSQLARLAGIGLATIKRIEASSEIRGAAETLWKIQTTLEKAGVEFIPGDEHKGPGVRLKERMHTKPKRARRKSD